MSTYTERMLAEMRAHYESNTYSTHGIAEALELHKAFTREVAMWVVEMEHGGPSSSPMMQNLMEASAKVYATTELWERLTCADRATDPEKA